MVDKDGSMKPCCGYITPSTQKFSSVNNIRHWWTIELENLRSDVTSNKSNPGCASCYQNEKNQHLLSLRQYTNLTYKEFPSTTPTLEKIDSLEIRMSNYCNLRCIMCGPYASSSIAQEYRDYADDYKIFGHMPTENTVRWWENISDNHDFMSVLKNSTKIHFSGGEPLLVPETIDMLNALDPTKLTLLHITTNLTRLNQRILDTLKKFSKVDITVSLEGIREHNDYIRYGSEWTTIEQNLKLLMSMPNVAITIHHVLQHTSVYTLPKFLAYCDNLGLNLSFIEVYFGSLPSPGVLTINSAADADVVNFKNWLSSYNGKNKNLLETWANTYAENDYLLEKFQAYVNVLDRIRNTNFQGTFNPTWAN